MNVDPATGCLIVAGIAALMILGSWVYILVEERGPKNEHPPDIVRHPRRGSGRYVMRSDGSGTMYGCVSEVAFDRLITLSGAEDWQGVGAMQALGLIHPLPSGTRVQRIDVGFLCTEIKVLDGSLKGRYLFVAADWVKQE